MKRGLPVLLAALALAWPAWAEKPGECMVAQHQLEHIFGLPSVARAIANKKLDVLVIGAGSSTLPGPEGAKRAYPARLQNALIEALPGVAVTVTTDVKPRRTAIEMVRTLKTLLATAKPQLVVWQTGTVDAMQSTDPDKFSHALDKGINLVRAAGADVILVNGQYSPRTESMIALGTYAENMRWVALQHEIPLFDRFDIMRTWSDLGVFDYTAAPNKLDMAERVHDCIGRLLADLIVETLKPRTTD